MDGLGPLSAPARPSGSASLEGRAIPPKFSNFGAGSPNAGRLSPFSLKTAGASFRGTMRRVSQELPPPTTVWGMVHRRITSMAMMPLFLSISVACVTYAFAVTRYQSSYVLLLERLHAAELEHERVVRQNKALVAGGDLSCAARTEMLKEEEAQLGAPPIEPQAAGFPLIAGSLILSGIAVIGRFIGQEYIRFHGKRGEMGTGFTVLIPSQQLLMGPRSVFWLAPA